MDCLIANRAVTLGRGYIWPNQLITLSPLGWIDSWHPLISGTESGCVWYLQPATRLSSKRLRLPARSTDMRERSQPMPRHLLVRGLSLEEAAT
jgi:hypothetical protein